MKVIKVTSELTLSFEAGGAWIKPSIGMEVLLEEGEKAADVFRRLQQQSRHLLIEQADEWTKKEEESA